MCSVLLCLLFLCEIKYPRKSKARAPLTRGWRIYYRSSPTAVLRAHFQKAGAVGFYWQTDVRLTYVRTYIVDLMHVVSVP